MRLSELARGLPMSPDDVDPEITGITEDSRRIRRGMLFVAVPGSALDGHAYIPHAISQGAEAVVVERAGAVPPGVPCIRVPSARIALADLSARLYESPPPQLTLIGFTGTFGKTSTSEILRALLEAGGQGQPGHFYDFPRGRWLVLSLLPTPPGFHEGVSRMARTLGRLFSAS